MPVAIDAEHFEMVAASRTPYGVPEVMKSALALSSASHLLVHTYIYINPNMSRVSEGTVLVLCPPWMTSCIRTTDTCPRSGADAGLTAFGIKPKSEFCFEHTNHPTNYSVLLRQITVSFFLLYQKPQVVFVTYYKQLRKLRLDAREGWFDGGP